MKVEDSIDLPKEMRREPKETLAAKKSCDKNVEVCTDILSLASMCYTIAMYMDQLVLCVLFAIQFPSQRELQKGRDSVKGHVKKLVEGTGGVIYLQDGAVQCVSLAFVCFATLMMVFLLR